MRDRLIELIKQAKKQTKNANCDIERNMIFADYLLENGVIVPPCKVGDVVKSDAIYYRVYRAETFSDFETPIHHRYFAEPINEEGEDDFWFWGDSVEEGNVIVCSKEEAEQALTCRDSRQDEKEGAEE